MSKSFSQELCCTIGQNSTNCSQNDVVVNGMSAVPDLEEAIGDVASGLPIQGDSLHILTPTITLTE
jgi:hypothetical protein